MCVIFKVTILTSVALIALGQYKDECGSLQPLACTSIPVQQVRFDSLFDQPRISGIESNIGYYGTIKKMPRYNATKEAVKMHEVLEEYGCSKQFLIEMLVEMNNRQRHQLIKAFNKSYHKDLMHEIKYLCKGHFEDVLIALLEDPIEFDVSQLHYSMKGFGTTERILIEILTTRSNEELAKIRKQYQRTYGRTLEKDVIGDTSGPFQRLLVALLHGQRSESCRYNQNKAKYSAIELWNATRKIRRSPQLIDSVYIRMFTEKSFTQLDKIFCEFKQRTGLTIEKVIEKLFKRDADMRNALLAIVKVAKNWAKFFAEELYKSMKGIGTRNNDLIRLIVSRAETDLALIRDEFNALYGKSLVEWIRDDTSGAYRDVLIAIVKGEF